MPIRWLPNSASSSGQHLLSNTVINIARCHLDCRLPWPATTLVPACATTTPSCTLPPVTAFTPPPHPHRYTLTTTPSPLHLYHYTLTATSLPLHPHHHTIPAFKATISLSFVPFAATLSTDATLQHRAPTTTTSSAGATSLCVCLRTSS